MNNRTLPPAFGEYACQAGLTEDEKYVVELLIDRVASKFDQTYWRRFVQNSGSGVRRRHGTPVNKKTARLAEPYLREITWLNLQGSSVKSLAALKYTPSLTGLVLSENNLLDISGVSICHNLERLCVGNNKISDISAIANLPNLMDLEIEENPIESIHPLHMLPKLSKLTLSAKQLSHDSRNVALSSVSTIRIRGRLDSFEDLPSMPMLTSIRGAEVQSLSGIERFSALCSLVNLYGAFPSLDPLITLRKLTHVNILGSSVDGVEGISGALGLRELYLNTSCEEVDLQPLYRLPALHAITVKCAGCEHPALDALRSTLSSWDSEFLAPRLRHTPSLELEVVDQATFDRYDTLEKFGISSADYNERLLDSESEWLAQKLEDDVFSALYENPDDYDIPYRWVGARSRTVVLYSDSAIEAFREIVLGIQKVLAKCVNDWIIYLQTDRLFSSESKGEFIVWVYPDKIQTTTEYAGFVRSLIEFS